MSTITTFVDGRQTHKKLGGDMVSAENRLDFSVTNAVASDTIQALKIPAGALVTNVRVLILTAEGGTSTATVGDGDGVADWDASINLNAAANTVTAGLAGTDTYATAGKYYATADTIDLVLSANALDAAIINVSAEYSVKERI